MLALAAHAGARELLAVFDRRLCGQCHRAHGSVIADWNRVLDTGIERDGKLLNPFMPIAMLRATDASERSALWNFLKAQPPRPFGRR